MAHAAAMRSLLLTVCISLLGCGAPGATLVLVVDRTSAAANGTDALLVTATSTGAGGVPVQDFVDFTVAAGGQLSEARVKGNGEGVATTKVTATTPGSFTVTATGPGKVSASVTATFVAASDQRLRFQASPSNTLANNLLRPVPSVVVENGAGVVGASSASVTVAITPGSCSASLDPASLMTVVADRGVASFYGLKVSTPATGCTLTATSGTLPQAVSTAFDIQ